MHLPTIKPFLTSHPFTIHTPICSTPTHFIESHIDIHYHWNEWELRRRALKIANLMKCETTAQQTDMSHFRRDNDAQVIQYILTYIPMLLFLIVL